MKQTKSVLGVHVTVRRSWNVDSDAANSWPQDEGLIGARLPYLACQGISEVGYVFLALLSWDRSRAAYRALL